MAEMKPKPCPFCGCKEIEVLEERNWFPILGFTVLCPDCGGMLTRYKDNTDQFMAEVIAAWNRRAE